MIYLCRNKRNGFVKIGYSTNPKSREKTLQSEEPEVFFEAIYEGSISDEQDLHRKFASKRIRGEWFELFEEDIAWIQLTYGDTLSGVRKEIMEEFASLIAGSPELHGLLDTIRWVKATGKSAYVVDEDEYHDLDVLRTIRHDWLMSPNPISDIQAVEYLRRMLSK